MRDVRKVEPSPRNIGSNKVTDLLLLELLEYRSTFSLIETSVYILNILKIFPYAAEQRVNLVSSITKNDRLINFFPLKIFDEFCLFAFWMEIGEIMLNAFWYCPLFNKRDKLGIPQTVIS
jgi:hypothetical protein